MLGAPSLRIVPKNLLWSAQHALSEPAIHAKSVKQSNIRDLSTLITLSALYDEIETLGNEAELLDGQKPYIAREYASITELTGLRIAVGPSASEFDDLLGQSISVAAYPFAMAKQNLALEELRSELAGSLRTSTSSIPDYWEDFAEGERLILQRDPNGQRSAPENFWLRSFLYAGLARLRCRPLVPDAIRSWGMPQGMPRLPDYGQQLEGVIEAKYAPEKMAELLQSPFPITPFAAVVFLRAGNDRKMVPVELKALREELAPVRQALRNFQAEKETADYSGLITIFGRAHTPSSKRAIDGRVDDALHALRKIKVPIPPQLTLLLPVFNVVKSAASLLTADISKIPGLIKTAKDAFDCFTNAKEFESTTQASSFLEVHHRLGWDLREWFNSGIKLENLFGPIQDDEPGQR